MFKILYNQIKYIYKQNKTHQLLVIILSIIIILGVVFSSKYFQPVKIERQPQEIINILETNNLDKQVEYYKELLNRVGVSKAQEYLYRSGLPFTGQTHLLNHTTGDFAYKKYGNKAPLYCKDHFLSSCYHGAILNIIAKEGIDSLEKTMDYCREKGTPVASQCAHGIGHGALAWVGYKNLTEALDICDGLAKKDSRFPIFNCHDGVFMENLWAVHNDGTPSPDRWVKDDDPYYPCNDSRIKEKWQSGCWSNQASVMYQMFGGDIEKVAKYCDAVKNNSYKETCYNNIARQIHPLTEGNIDEALYYCGLLPKEKTAECLLTISNADYSVGGRQLSYEICATLSVGKQKESCYQNLNGNIRLYYGDFEERKVQCMQIREGPFQKQCIQNVTL